MGKPTTPFWKDKHFYSALAAIVFGILLNHVKAEPWATDLHLTYSTLCAFGILAARTKTDTEISLTRSNDHES